MSIDLPHPSLSVIEAVAEHPPLIQCLTNAVVMEITANVLLAIGASPAMTDTPEESADFAAAANGVLINAGTPSAEQYAGMREAIRGATAAGTPWVLDPVAVGGLKTRTDFAHEIVASHPAAIRGNASEVVALAKMGAGGRGVDATDAVEAAIPAATRLAAETGAVVAVSGPRDVIISRDRMTWVDSGDPMLQLVIGSGCSLGAACAAYLGVAKSAGLDPHDAVVAAHAHLGAAGSIAATNSNGPGSFAVAWLDAMYQLDAPGIADLVNFEVER